MQNKVVSVGQKPDATVRGDDSALRQPAWLGSTPTAIIITALIAISAIAGGQWGIRVTGLSFGWAFVIAGIIIAAEMVGLAAAVARIRRAYQRRHAEPPFRPLDLAA